MSEPIDPNKTVVTKDDQRALSKRLDEILADMPKGRECPKCGGMMAHSRLRGYYCIRECGR